MNQEHMDSISLEIHMCLEMKGGQCLAKCALIYLTPKYIPPLSFSSPQNHSKLCLMSNYGWVLETLETWSGLSSWS